MLGQALLRLCEEGRGAEAERIALELSTTGRDPASALYSLARVRFAVGRRVEAIRTLEEALASPHRPWIWGRNPESDPESDLARFRRSVAPELVTPASVDDALIALAGVEEGEFARGAESIRRRLRREYAPALGAYLDGRLLELGGDLKGAEERYRAAIELDRSLVTPFTRLYESLRLSRGHEVADSVVRAQLAKGAPAGLLQLPPQPPRDLEAWTEEEGMRFRASDFAHVDRRVRHVASRWRVRREGGDYDRSPVVDTVSREHLTELKLPPEGLDPRTKYFWTVSYLGNAGGFATSEEGSFVTEDYAFETERFSLERHFNRDVVANPGDGSGDTIDEASSLVVEGFNEERGLPPNGRVGVHRLGDYSGLNCIQLRASDTNAIRIDVPRRRYHEVRFLVTGSFGDTRIPVTFLYADGNSETRTLFCDDWLDDPTVGQSVWGAIAKGVQPIANGMDAHPGEPHHRGDVALFEASLETDRARTLAAFVLQPAGMRVASEQTRFNLLAATGIWTKEGADGRR